MSDLSNRQADLTTHHIEGIAAMNNQRFFCPLISHVEGNLWQGGTPADVGALPSDFEFVINLYPWETYKVSDKTTEMKVRLYDAAEVPDPVLLHAIADWINVVRKKGKTLVHCQAGLNRSGLVTALALIKSGMSAKDAVALLRDQRSPAVLCNSTFEKWLYEEEERLNKPKPGI